MSKQLSNTSGIYSIRDLEQHYQKLTKGHWFSKSTLRFFNSRLSEKLHYGKRCIYFVSSEAAPMPPNPRRYSVRRYNTETGDISTMGEFQQYKSSQAANTAAQALASAESEEL